MASTSREISPVGTVARLLTALALFFIAGGATIASWAIEPEDALIGLVALPTVLIALGLVAAMAAARSVSPDRSGSP